MKATKISELPIISEQCGVSYNPNFVDTDMTVDERLFISGLIKYYEPKNILEIGVAGGGGTANILNTIQEMDTTLVSIDVVEKFHHPYVGELEVGKYAFQEFSHLSSDKWRLLLGKDPAERMEYLNDVFDFLILDTNHVHPSETLNFLCALPYLTENAIVVLHDTTLYMYDLARNKKLSCFATRILMSTVCADKLEPNIVGFGGFTNIVAFQVSSDTKKYLRNVFDSLMLPWEWFPDTIDVVGDFIDKHYSMLLKKIFLRSIELNTQICLMDRKWPPVYRKKITDSDLIFYGAGANMRKIIDTFEFNEVEFTFSIWDKNSETIKAVNGCTVVKPDFENPAKSGQVMVITIENEKFADDVRKQFEPLGYTVFHGLIKYIMSL